METPSGTLITRRTRSCWYVTSLRASSLQVHHSHYLGTRGRLQASDPQSQAAAAALEEKQRIQADNVGHKLLSKMGWKEGQVGRW